MLVAVAASGAAPSHLAALHQCYLSLSATRLGHDVNSQSHHAHPSQYQIILHLSINCRKCVRLIQYHGISPLIFTSSLFAGGIFTFPLLAPALALQLKLTQPQLTTIALL